MQGNKEIDGGCTVLDLPKIAELFDASKPMTKFD